MTAQKNMGGNLAFVLMQHYRKNNSFFNIPIPFSNQ